LIYGGLFRVLLKGTGMLGQYLQRWNWAWRALVRAPIAEAAVLRSGNDRFKTPFLRAYAKKKKIHTHKLSLKGVGRRPSASYV